MRTFLDVVKNRKSVRSFLSRPIDSLLIKEILSIATYAPTSCNQQLWNFIIIDDEYIKERLIKEAIANTLIRRVPVIIAVTYDGWNYKEAIQGASLAAGHILLAAEYYGIGSLPMNSYGSDKMVKKILEIPEKEVICCFIALGYVDDSAQKSSIVPRRPIKEVMHKKRFNNNTTPPFTYNPNDWSLDDLRSHQKYYCRKTFSGKEMDIMNKRERMLVRNIFASTKGHILDLLSYDGSYLKEFSSTSVTVVDLTKETSLYTESAVQINTEHISSKTSYVVYDEQKTTFVDSLQSTISLVYKLERIPDNLKKKIFTQTFNTLRDDGEFIIIARKSNIFLSFFFWIIKFLFGGDMRKTGIYNFFGPYKPIGLRKTEQQLREAGFVDISWSGYFFLPVFYEEIYQMLLQYIYSGGSSYLHREKRIDVISRLLAFVMKIQGLRKFGRLGSVVVITCKKQ